jgi:hypothetical protein
LNKLKGVLFNILGINSLENVNKTVHILDIPSFRVIVFMFSSELFQGQIARFYEL